MTGKLIILSAPSGSGKTTVMKHLTERYDNLGFSISCCTRLPRGAEVDGKDYYFLSLDEFQKNIREDKFAEYEEVYTDNFYGTLKSEVERLWGEGKHVVFDVDVKGGLKLKKLYKEKALALFVKVPDISILEARLRMRGTEDEESLKRRLDKAQEEMSYQFDFDEILINDKIENALAQADYFLDKFFAKK